MNRSTYRPFLTLLAGTACLTLIPHSAPQAGFEWTPPAAMPEAPAPTPVSPDPMMPAPMPLPAPINPAPAAPPAPQPMTVPMPQPEPLAMPDTVSTPMPLPAPTNMSPEPAPAPMPLPAPVSPAVADMQGTYIPEIVTPVDNIQTPPPAPQQMDVSTGTIIRGFGEEIPLVIAMRQIVPASHAFSFGNGVDLGARVSWTGGQDWRTTLMGMVSELGYMPVFSGNTVRIDVGTAPVGTPSPQMMPAHSQDMMTPTPFVMNNVGFPHNVNPNQSIANNDTPISLMPGSTPPPAMGLTSPPQAREIDPMMTPEPSDMTMPSPMQPSMAMASSASQTMPAAPNTGMLNAERTWKVAKGSDLRLALQSWADEAGVTLNWQAPNNLSIDYMVWVDGTFEEAVDTLMKGFEAKSDLSPSAALRVDPLAGPVLDVTMMRPSPDQMM